MSANRYGTREVLGGRHRVVKLFGNEGFAEKRSYATAELAKGRATQLERAAARRESVAEAKRRAKNHCECKGKCGQHFQPRPCIWGEGEDIPGVGKDAEADAAPAEDVCKCNLEHAGGCF